MYVIRDVQGRCFWDYWFSFSD